MGGCAVGSLLGAPIKFLNVLPQEDRAYYYGQEAEDGVIELNATNGFFDRCFQAGGMGPADPEDQGMIRATFDHLRKGSADHGSARWHLWLPKPGTVQLRFLMTVPEAERGTEWTIRVGDQVQRLKTNSSDGRKAQDQGLRFDVAEAGKVTVAIDCSEQAPAKLSKIHRIQLKGAAVQQAKLLRARWRPAAAHLRFQAPDQCPEPKMWLFESVSVSQSSSYSPITTPFGYYGTVFNAEGKVNEGAGFNFSMWAVSMRGNAKTPPVEQMPRLIGTGISDAVYSSFGHEGTGLKFRNAVAYPDGAGRLIQAMRTETRNGVTTYYAYFYDESQQLWRLYGSGQKVANKKGSGELRSTGSFCEVPGPPQRERSGDIKRVIKRRGWFYGSDQKWHRAEIAKPSAKALRGLEMAKAAIAAGEDPGLDSEQNYYADDYASKGWVATATGGMENFLPLQQHQAAYGKEDADSERPAYMSPEKTAELFHLPVEFGTPKVTALGETSATVHYPIVKSGPNAKAVLYYGTKDCITFLANVAQSGSAAQKEIFSEERTWQSHTAELAVAEAVVDFQLSGLKPKTQYFYRVFVSHDDGKSWDEHSSHFTTE
ncbi:DUF3472 domain-containing protein [Verrucomicrobiaceae bacterium 5K15]|uniref:DUF3472 domain-containing protein n=1 Tax=Oceaniferula flava TaxID=2800421 RepID=A0AAE2SE05_9BACT|nr:DUF3472 domain-containing protein [Oceaniferula flavus]MBK1854785.1 DUF3472 domain-containing protein [Oceaniferula flavus]MBM1136091.1 DUF3472 domain-containing protein [Oceaniferula flavus]